MAYDKVVDSGALDAALTDVADAIRTRGGTTASLTLEEMPDAIAAISGGDDSVLVAFMNGDTTELVSDKITHLNPNLSDGVTVVDLPECTTTATAVFSGNGSLREIVLPKLLYTTVQWVLRCSNLTKIDIPACTSIDNYGFYGCSKLERLDLPSVTRFSGQRWFNDCKLLTKLILRAPSVATLASSDTGFSSTPIAPSGSTSGVAYGTGYIYVPDDLVDSYKVATNWAAYADRFRPLSELEDDA